MSRNAFGRRKQLSRIVLAALPAALVPILPSRARADVVLASCFGDHRLALVARHLVCGEDIVAQGRHTTQ